MVTDVDGHGWEQVVDADGSRWWTRMGAGGGRGWTQVLELVIITLVERRKKKKNILDKLGQHVVVR